MLYDGAKPQRHGSSNGEEGDDGAWSAGLVMGKNERRQAGWTATETREG